MAWQEILSSLLAGLFSKEVEATVSIPIGQPANAVDPLKTLYLMRTCVGSTGVFGELILDGERLAYTLEHSYDGKPKLPTGMWTCKRRLSPHFGYDVFQVMDVPGHDFIEIHRGNTEADSEGCILLGTATDGDALTESKLAFEKFMAAMEGQDTFHLVVSDSSS